MRFKNKQDYLAQRQALIDETQVLIDEGKAEDAKAKMEDVKAMDQAYEDFAKTMADLQALAGNASVKDITNMSTVNVAGTIVDSTGLKSNEVEDMYNTVEYRKAFMNNVMFGKQIPQQFTNTDASSTTTDTKTVIPTTLVNQIIQKLETVGKIYAKVTKTHLKGGVSYPTSSVKPVATWVSEGAGSDKQKKSTGSITFTWHKLRCAISMSLETETMTLDVFETTFVAEVSGAMVKAIETSIFNGNGTSQPKGILQETPQSGQALSLASGKHMDYKFLLSCEAAVPEEYDSGAEWYMTKKTFYEEVLGITDTNGQPVARVNVGINGKPEYMILGRRVNFTQYMSNYVETPTANTIFGIIFNMSDYVLNENLSITVKAYEDNDTDDQVRKAVALVDGKCVQTYSLVTVTINK